MADFRIEEVYNGFMGTEKEMMKFILDKLGEGGRFKTLSMFGNYALYADNKVVGLICNNQLYVKILQESIDLEGLCEKDTPFDGARDHYLIEEWQIDKLPQLQDILFDISKSRKK